MDRALALQFLKFGIVGISNTLITLLVYTLLVKVFGVWYIAASAIGFAVGAVNGFLLNRRWTFSGHVGDAFTPLRWLVVQGSGLLVNLALVYLFVTNAGFDKLLGQACATAIVVVLTFLANHAWTFRASPVDARSPRERAAGESPRGPHRRLRRLSAARPAETGPRGSRRRDRSGRPRGAAAVRAAGSAAPGAPTDRGSTRSLGG